MECMEKKECVMHGGGGNDNFNQTPTSYDFTPEDFNKKDDKIYLHKQTSMMDHALYKAYFDPDKQEVYVYSHLIAIDPIKKIYLPRFSYSEVQGWVDVATGKKKVDPSVFDDNPIIIK